MSDFFLSSSWLLVYVVVKKLKNAVLTMNDMLTCLHETNIFKSTKSWKSKKDSICISRRPFKEDKIATRHFTAFNIFIRNDSVSFLARTFIAIKTFYSFCQLHNCSKVFFVALKWTQKILVSFPCIWNIFSDAYCHKIYILRYIYPWL